MFSEKIKSGSSGLLLYGITPPKAGTSPERMGEIATKTIERLSALDIDALVVYDVQDESARTQEERPFPFLNAHDPLEFACGYLGAYQLPKIIYRPAGKYSTEELAIWLDELQQRHYYPVFVGLPAPDYPVKTSLPEAYKIWAKHKDSSVIGAVTIPERHDVLKDEDRRILDKMSCGVSFFISQCVFNVGFTKKMVEDIKRSCQGRQDKLPTLIFTLTACGSPKTLHFMEWLGIHVSDELKEHLKASANMLQESVNVCLRIAEEITSFCMEHSIPFGFNIESVAIRKEEIEASVQMAQEIGKLLKSKGFR